MDKSVLILGANGTFGRALTSRMALAGWHVKALSRQHLRTDSHTGSNHGSIECLIGDVGNDDALQAAALKVNAIVHAINVPYPKWDPFMIVHTRRIVELAQRHNAHLFFVGNIYNAGVPDSGVIDANTPDQPVTSMGEIRARLETMIRQAASTEMTTTIMRFGDFFGPDIFSPNWFNEATKLIHKNRLVLPGPADIPHTWAYIPDAVAAMEKVIDIRVQDHSTERKHGPYKVLPYAGHSFTFNDLKRELEELRKHSLKTKSVPWKLFKAFGLVIPVFRDLSEMRYLWNHKITMDDSALLDLIGKLPENTPLNQAIAATLSSE